MRPTIINWVTEAGGSVLGWIVPSANVVFAFTVATAAWLFLRRATQAGLSPQLSMRGVFAGLIGGLIGARFFHLIAYGDPGPGPLGMLSHFTGTTSWGAYLGVAAGLVIILRWNGAPVLPYCDVAASCTGLGIVLGRIACFLNGDDFGRVTSLPWAVRYPLGSEPYEAHVAGGLLPPGVPESLPIHPFQLYLALSALIVFVVVSNVWRHAGRRPGYTLGVFLLLDGTTRFWIEFLRDPAAGGGTGALSISQWMCLCAVATGSVILSRTAAASRMSQVTLRSTTG